VTALCPISFFVGYYVLVYFSSRKVTGLNSALMIVGIWCLGGIAMMISASFAGGGFSVGGRGATTLISLLALVCPPITFIMATYDGSLLALIVGTALICAEAATLSARVVQPKLWKAAG
jgi:hypothetical protein